MSMKSFPHGKRTVGYVDEMRRAPWRDIDRFDNAGAGTHSSKVALIVMTQIYYVRADKRPRHLRPEVVRREYYRGSVV
jgi:hypothetical protein